MKAVRQREKGQNNALLMGGSEFEFEYVDKATSEMLLDKFPDASVYDFDYEESAIWSPLPPRSYNCTTTFLAEIKPKKKKKQKQKKQPGSNGGSHKLVKKFFKRTSRLPLNSSTNSFGSTQKAQAWSRLLRVASRCFKSRPSLSSSAHILHLSRELNFSESK